VGSGLLDIVFGSVGRQFPNRIQKKAKGHRSLGEGPVKIDGGDIIFL